MGERTSISESKRERQRSRQRTQKRERDVKRTETEGGETEEEGKEGGGTEEEGTNGERNTRRREKEEGTAEGTREKEEGEKLCEALERKGGHWFFMEASAKTNTNVDELFRKAISEAMAHGTSWVVGLEGWHRSQHNVRIRRAAVERYNGDAHWWADRQAWPKHCRK